MFKRGILEESGDGRSTKAGHTAYPPVASGGYQHDINHPDLARIPRCNRLAKAAAINSQRPEDLATFERRTNTIRSLLRVTLGE